MDAVKALSSSVLDVKASKHNFIFYVLLLHVSHALTYYFTIALSSRNDSNLILVGLSKLAS